MIGREGDLFMESTIDLLGRKGAYAQLDIAINLTRTMGKRLLVALIDLDRFHRVNETRGTEFGNYVLSVADKRLSDTTSNMTGAVQPVMKRLDGNTFLAIMPVDDDPRSCDRIELLKYAVERPVPDGVQELYMTASVGASFYPQDGLTSEQLMCRAESALYKAKDSGGNAAMFYNPEDTQRMSRKLMIETELRPALFLRQFHLDFQPIRSIEAGGLRGYEAFIRWNHPELGMISPREFIPVAEHNGLIVPIGEWVLREACRMLSESGQDELIMSVNISPLQLLDPAFAATVLNTIAEFKLLPGHIELEITESILTRSSDLAISTLSRLRAAGVRIALDDFGIGHSSFNTLKLLPIQCLKIDKSFVGQIDLLGAERHIVESIIGLVKKLGLEVIAEGVEYEEQYSLLKEWGCNYAQGHLLGSPAEWEHGKTA